MRKIKFENGYYYHIYNRGVDKREVFCDKDDYINFLFRLRDFNDESTFEERVGGRKEKELNSLAAEAAKELSSFSLPRLVEIIAYCLNPNHYHLLLKQLTDKGIEKFMHKIGTGYTNNFNKRYSRSGSLFQGRYKSREIKTDAQLLYVSAYINGNPEIHKIAKADKWAYSSYRDYLGKRKGTLANKNIVLKEFEID